MGTAHDVTQSSRVHDELVRMAEQDPLTGLPNRRALTRALEQELANNSSGALLVLDLDNFKDVNDLRGHAVGDRVMRMLASALQSRLGDRLIARLGGDEFAVVLPGRRRRTRPRWLMVCVMRWRVFRWRGSVRRRGSR